MFASNIMVSCESSVTLKHGSSLIKECVLITILVEYNTGNIYYIINTGILQIINLKLKPHAHNI